MEWVQLGRCVGLVDFPQGGEDGGMKEDGGTVVDRPMVEVLLRQVEELRLGAPVLEGGLVLEWLLAKTLIYRGRGRKTG